MTYRKNFVCAIKVGGKVLRESSERVELPFGSEYAVLLKNMDSVRMQARISIDGKDATGWLIIGPNQSVDVERFVENLDRGNRFKFIERTESIENHRGVKAEDGLVRVEFKREKVFEAPKVVHHQYYHYNWPHYSFIGGCFGGTFNQNVQSNNTLHDGHNVTVTSTSGASGGLRGPITMNEMSMMRSAQASVGESEGALNSPVNEAGITVPGSLSSQKFVTVMGFETEQSEVIVLHLVGKKAGAPVKVAKTVHAMLQCDTCGRTSKSSAKFCKECGTSLERV